MALKTLPKPVASSQPRAGDALVRTAVAATPLFANIADELLRSVADAGEAVSIRAGQLVFRQGEPGDTLYCVLSGEIRISRKLDDGGEVELRRAAAGDSFGELALLDGGARDATARAVLTSQLFALRRERFLDAVPRAPKLLSTVLANLVQLVRATTELVFHQELEQRVLHAEMAAEKYRALAQMVAGVAHEINTPIGIVNTAASIVKQRLATADVNPDVHEALDLIDANIRRADRLIRDFKQLSVGHLTDTKEVLSLVEVVHEVVGLFRINARQARLTIDIDNVLPDAVPDTWVGYRGFLSQVLLNLLTNIERYAYDRDGGRVAISIGDTTDRRGEAFRIVVRDWGRGMAAETRARIFEPFYTTGRSKGGTGLGMSIVHNLMTSALKGSVDVAAAEGAGTTITLTFPKTVPE